MPEGGLCLPGAGTGTTGPAISAAAEVCLEHRLSAVDPKMTSSIVCTLTSATRLPLLQTDLTAA